MSKSHDLFKHRAKPKIVYIKHSKEKPSIHYVRDFYSKDFEYISPRSVAGKNYCSRNSVKRIDGNRVGGCRLFAKLWLYEVMKGLKQFLYEGSLHGVKYIFEPSFTRKERLTWIIIVVISVVFCVVNIIKLFTKWTSTPCVNVLDSMPTPIWAIPFPSVVLCPHLHVKSSYANISQLSNLERIFASLVCPQMQAEKTQSQHRLTAEEIKMLQNFIIQGSPSCKEVIRGCSWKTRNGTDWSTEDCCEKLFKPMFTDYGLCFSFNSLPLFGFTNESLAWVKILDPDAESREVEWNIDRGYPKNFLHEYDLVPWSVKSAGESSGLGLDLYFNTTEHQTSCEGKNVGFTVLVMPPMEHVFSGTIIRLPMSTLVTIQVDPISYKTEASLRAVEPRVRRCYFQNERNLEHLLSYSTSNCKFDTYVKQTRKICKCVLYSWPRADISEPVCSTQADFECLDRIRDRIEEEQLHTYDVDDEAHKKQPHNTTLCYPSCNYLKYNSHVFYSDLIRHDENIPKHDLLQRTDEYIQMNVHFQNNLFYGQYKHAQYDEYYFAGAIGGILSLFLGFSIISVAELIYFLILKPIYVAFSLLYIQINQHFH